MGDRRSKLAIGGYPVGEVPAAGLYQRLRHRAIEPSLLLNLVSGFIGAHAPGVIGTETTVFEPLATVFAEACLKRFLVERKPIGEAVRLAGLDLLQSENPMGLVYTPFILPSVQLERPH
jgi:hypothetical protein